MKVWITKYALTKGIQQETAKEGNLTESGSLSYGVYGWAPEGDWHRTESSALAKAEQMRLAKIASLKKQIAKLDKLRFEPGK